MININYFVDNNLDEIEKCMDKKCYFAALKMALELPKICVSGIEKDVTPEDYIAWCNEWMAHKWKLKNENPNYFDISKEIGIVGKDYTWGDLVYKLYARMVLSEDAVGISEALDFIDFEHVSAYTFGIMDYDVAPISYGTNCFMKDNSHRGAISLHLPRLVFDLMFAAEDFVKADKMDASILPSYAITYMIGD